MRDTAQAETGAGAAPSGGERLPLIRLDDVHLTLASAAGPVNILRGLDLSVAAGEALAVLGPSGAGKSSLLALIAGLERPSRGRVRIEGVDLATLSEDALARFRRRRLGIVFQSFHLIATLTALENVALPLELAGDGEAFARARAALAAAGLGHRLDHYPAQLSGGEQQRTAVARAVVGGPKILLADEPTGNLDAASGQAISDLLFAERDRLGSTLLLVTHDEALAARCDRVLLLDDGRIAGAAGPGRPQGAP